VRLQIDVPTLGRGSTFDPDYLNPEEAMVAVEPMAVLVTRTVAGRTWWVVV
jgi:hypothetical protein